MRGGAYDPAFIKTIGYLVSTASVALLGVAAYLGSEKAGLTPLLFAGMAASAAGMALRRWSYEVEERLKKVRAAGLTDEATGGEVRAGSAV